MSILLSLQQITMSDLEDDSSEDGIVIDVKTPKEIMTFGLQLLGYSQKQIDRKSKRKHEKNNNRFRASFGIKPHVAAQVWEDLQVTPIKKDKILPEKMSLEHFLIALHFIKRYPTEKERENTWHKCDRILRD